jgi:tRNA (mo5U34)-methyltransferase
MISYQALYDALIDAKADAWADILPQQLERAFDQTRHGDLAYWQALVDSVPELPTSQRIIDADTVQIGGADELDPVEQHRFNSQLKTLHPWRKGPYNLFGIHIDTEWRSDWKWNRLKKHITPLTHRLVLDVGCGNGYHCCACGLGQAVVNRPHVAMSCNSS